MQAKILDSATRLGRLGGSPLPLYAAGLSLWDFCLMKIAAHLVGTEVQAADNDDARLGYCLDPVELILPDGRAKRCGQWQPTAAAATARRVG